MIDTEIWERSERAECDSEEYNDRENKGRMIYAQWSKNRRKEIRRMLPWEFENIITEILIAITCLRVVGFIVACFSIFSIVSAYSRHPRLATG